jgi:hypothetical protein
MLAEHAQIVVTLIVRHKEHDIRQSIAIRGKRCGTRNEGSSGQKDDANHVFHE